MLSKVYDGVLLETKINDDSIVNETLFWEFIERSSTHEYHEQVNNLSSDLSKLDHTELQIFQNTLDFLMSLSYRSDLWNKVYSINMGCSDDCFEYFRTWLIAQGKDRFYLTLQDPNYLVYFGEKEILQKYEGLGYVALEIAESRGQIFVRHPKIPDYKLNNPEMISNIGVSGIALYLMTWLN